MRRWMQFFPHKRLLVILLAILLVVDPMIAVAMVYWHGQAECFRILKGSTIETAKQMKGNIENDKERLMTFARILEAYEDLTVAQAQSVICTYQGYDMMRDLVLLLPNGDLLLCDGRNDNLSGEVDFEEEVKKGIYTTDIETSRIDPELKLIAHCVPIMHDEETIGLLYGVIELDTLSQQYQVTAFGGNAKVHLINSVTGDYILDAWHCNHAKLYENETEDQNYTALQEGIRNGGEGCIAFQSSILQEKFYCYYMPLDVNDWTITLGVTESIALEGKRQLGIIIVVAFFVEIVTAILLCYLIFREKLRDAHTIQKMAETDLLTGLKNRNSYQAALDRYQNREKKSAGCIYVDVNGLHELNNHLGHAAGDEMLKTVAGVMQKVFGEEHTYRIGGDEFVAFCFGEREVDVYSKMKELEQRVEEQNYHISAGMAYDQEAAHAGRLVVRAEKQMYEAKKEFYRKNGNIGKMREMNRKLEEILLQKKDADTFLNVIAPHFFGVYIVNMNRNELRSIYIPPYFEELLHRADHEFEAAFKLYIQEQICEPDQGKLWQYANLAWLRQCLEKEDVVKVMYQKKDGIDLVLRIYLTTDSEGNHNETIWLFEKNTK